MASETTDTPFWDAKSRASQSTFFTELLSEVDRRIRVELERPETLARIAAAVVAIQRAGLIQAGEGGAGRPNES